MSEKLNTILERFKSKLSYREQDRQALDISRAAAAGSLGESEYSEWALISNDPLVVVNYVKTFITTLASKLSSAPFRPADDNLNEIAVQMRLNSLFTELYRTTLADGYAFLGIGMKDNKPIANIVDARSVMFNGSDPTLKDATELVVFEILPKSRDEDFISDFPSGYVEYDTENEKIRTSYYHIENGVVNLDVYEDGKPEPNHYEIPNINRIPVIRFYGERVELTDKRYHYRGLYYQLAGVIKATALAATKLQIRTAMSDDDNYMVSADAISNHKGTWRNAGVKTFDSIDVNGNPIQQPVIPITHDNAFLINAVNLWKNITADLLGPVVQSSSEAITREEVLARNEVRDAIANTYLQNISDSVSEVYRVIQGMTTGNNEPVIVQGGFLEAVQRSKTLNQIVQIYQLAKDSGLNAQGFVLEILANSALPMSMKQRTGQLLMQDPYASPAIKQAQTQIQKLNQTIDQQQKKIAILQIQATQRLERQAEWTASQERIARFETMFKQWQQENKDIQEARMELMRRLLDNGDYQGAMSMVRAIQQQASAPSMLSEPETQLQMAQATKQAVGNVGAQIGETQNVVASNSGGSQQSQSETEGRPNGTGRPVAGGNGFGQQIGTQQPSSPRQHPVDSEPVAQ